MSHFGHTKLSTVCIYGTILAIIIGVSIDLGLDLVERRTKIIQEKLDLASQQSQFMSQWFGTTVVSADYVLRDILDKIRPEKVVTCADNVPECQRYTPWLAKKMATIPSAFNLFLFDSDCKVRVSAEPLPNGMSGNLSFCMVRQPKTEDRMRLQYQPADESISLTPAILVSRSHVSSEGRFLGGAAAAFHFDELQNWLLSFPLSPHDVLAVIDGNARVLALNPPDSASLGETAIPSSNMPIITDARSASNFVAISPLDNRMRAYGVSNVENIPLLCVVGFDLDDSLNEWKSRVLQLFGGFLGMILLYMLALRAHLLTLKQRDDVRALATTDHLTGVANRRRLVLEGEQNVLLSLRYKRPLSIAMIDIDKFKSVNDQWGHPTGDRAIQALANAMSGITRIQDVVGRIGGEEFVIILPETDLNGAVVIAERLREYIQNDVCVASDENVTVRFTISIGIATLTMKDKKFDDLLMRADKALYAAKNGGRNQVFAV
ncbi:GGDEF domain-containing protein [Desulfovibrio sp. UIB00]|uniref:sensor domain-containing diguanylate cyclase n=1 Tax=Desulfovibrio sp. UIB00 TaxID=2804314 RepID=UPI001F0E137F|nr:diguanylate cyclase [Desulfovibrio sp. UIB00]MCH5146157.1 GGDEF domain-containing protein [Desulfovibrio sp. UIB00]